jgi:hypothetical protein
MTARQKTTTKTNTRWVDDCTVCGSEMSVLIPGDIGFTAGKPPVCGVCRNKQAADKLRDELAYLIGATVVEVVVETNTCYPDPTELRLRCTDGHMFTARAVSDYDGGAELKIEEEHEAAR